MDLLSMVNWLYSNAQSIQSSLIRGMELEGI